MIGSDIEWSAGKWDGERLDLFSLEYQVHFLAPGIQGLHVSHTVSPGHMRGLALRQMVGPRVRLQRVESIRGRCSNGGRLVFGLARKNDLLVGAVNTGNPGV